MLYYTLKSMASGIIIFLLAAPLPFYINAQTKKLSLKDAIETGLANNPDIRIAEENINISEGKFWSGISLPQPEVSLEYEYVPLNKPLSGYGEKTIAVTQQVDFPVKYFLRGSKYSGEKEIALKNRDLTERMIITRIKTAYYRVLAVKKQEELAQQILNLNIDFFKKAEIKLNTGEGTNLEKLTARVQYMESLNNLEIIRNDLNAAASELNFSLGYSRQNNNEGFVLTDSMTFVDYNINTEGLFAALDESSPEINIAELKSGIASVENSLAWYSLLPDFNFSFYRQAMESDPGFYGASFGITLPVWFLFDQRGKIEEAAAGKQAAQSELIKTKNEAALKLTGIIASYKNNLRQVKLYLDDILPHSEEIYRTALDSYNAGELSYLEYLQAERTLVNSRNSYAGVLFNYYLSLFNIEELTGINIMEYPEWRNK